jgi:hypothetical protein
MAESMVAWQRQPEFQRLAARIWEWDRPDLSEETPVVATIKGVPPMRTAVQPQMVRENS